MTLFEEMTHRGHEQVVWCSDPQVGLRAIIAIHSTVLGPALGGTRMWTYAREEDALRDVLRLSRGMTYKGAIAGLNLGGGKAVIIGDPNKDKTEALFRTYGRFVERLGGRYITAEDVGTTVREMEWVRMETTHVTGVSKSTGGGGDPSPVTAFGVLNGMKACAKEVYGSDSLSGKSILVQGAGNVASHLCRHLAKEGARITLTDLFEAKALRLAKEVGGTYVKPDRLIDMPADIFTPCALGGILNDETIPRLKVRIVAGGANNQLLDEQKHMQMLIDRQILYAPDYAINAGGMINVANELEGYREGQALKQAEGIYDILRTIFRIAKEENIATLQAANNLAEARIHSGSALKQMKGDKPVSAPHRRIQTWENR